MSRTLPRDQAIKRVAQVELAALSDEARADAVVSLRLGGWQRDAEWRDLSEEVRSQIADEQGCDPASPALDPALLIYVKHDLRHVSNTWLAEQTGCEITGEDTKGEICPCCGYRTLDELGHFDICDICWWEDDGQTDADADKVYGGPNEDLSLTKARANFVRHGLYNPQRQDLRDHQVSRARYQSARRYGPDGRPPP